MSRGAEEKKTRKQDPEEGRVKLSEVVAEEGTSSRRAEEAVEEGPAAQQEKTGEEDDDDDDDERKKKSVFERGCEVYKGNMFLVNVILAIALARAAPVVGNSLAPEITKSIAVGIIFFFTGLGLKSKEILKAFMQIKYNSFVQCFNLGVMPVGVWLVASFLASTNAINRGLADGMVVCAALPMTVNMAIVLTKSGGGDEAAAVNNSVIGNLLGVVITPLWVVALLGKSSSVDFLSVLTKIALRVLLPFFVGQLAQFNLPSVAAWAKRRKPYLKRLQEWLLTFIVYLVFCGTFANGVGTSATAVVVMVLVQVALLCVAMAAAWFSLGAAFPSEPKLRVAGLFGCTHKTVAMGVPLIDAIFASSRFDDNRGYYLLPLLVWHPAQLIIGSALTTRLARWVTQESERLGAISSDDDSPT